MIARVWRGQTTAENAGAYLRHLMETVLPSLRAIAGFRGARVLRRRIETGTEYVVLTHWDSWDSIRAFAGDEAERAVVEPAARAVLSEYDDHVRHFEVVHDSVEPDPTSRDSSWAV